MMTDDGHGMRQIHIRVAADIHRRLKVMAAMRDVTISDLLQDRVLRLVMKEVAVDGTAGK